MDGPTEQSGAFPQEHDRSAVRRVLAFVERARYGLFSAVGVMHLAAFTGRWRPGADSAELLVQARAWRRGQVLTETDAGDLPGYPWLLSQLGDDPVRSVLLLQLLGTALWLTLWYQLLKRVVGRPTAVLVVALTGVAARSVQMEAEVLPEALFATALAVALLGAELLRSKATPVQAYGIAVLALGITGMLTLRTVGVLAVAALLLAAGLHLWNQGDRRRRVMLLVGAGAFTGSCVAALVWVPQLSHDATALIRSWRNPAESGGVLDNVGKLLGATWPEAGLGLDPTLLPGLAVSIPWVVSAVLLYRVRREWGVLIALLLVQWVVFQTSVRYVIPVLPLLMLAAWRLLVSVHRRVGEPGGGWAVYVLLALLVTSNAVGYAALSKEQRAAGAPLLDDYRHGKYAPARTISAFIAERTPPDAVVVMSHEVRAEMAWWADRRFVRYFDKPMAEAFPGVYAVGPLSDDLITAFGHMNWALGPALVEANNRRRGEPWALHEVIRTAAPPTATPEGP